MSAKFITRHCADRFAWECSFNSRKLWKVRYLVGKICVGSRLYSAGDYTRMFVDLFLDKTWPCSQSLSSQMQAATAERKMVRNIIDLITIWKYGHNLFQLITKLLILYPTLAGAFHISMQHYLNKGNRNRVHGSANIPSFFPGFGPGNGMKLGSPFQGAKLFPGMVAIRKQNIIHKKGMCKMLMLKHNWGSLPSLLK